MDALSKGLYSALLVAALSVVLLVLGGCNDDMVYKRYDNQPPVPSRTDFLGFIEECRLYRIKEVDSNKWKYLVICPPTSTRRPAITMEGSAP